VDLAAAKRKIKNRIRVANKRRIRVINRSRIKLRSPLYLTQAYYGRAGSHLRSAGTCRHLPANRCCRDRAVLILTAILPRHQQDPTNGFQ
jgi:hypothetical protein